MSSLVPPDWTGVRLSPLPHESTLSALWRFGWQNGLTGRSFFQTCCGTRGFTNKPSSLMLGLSDSFVKETNWCLPCRAEVECLQLASNMVGNWLHRKLRFCPVCLQAGYHSIWHQFILLNACPLHNCVLTEKCQSCGADTEYFGATSQLTSRPYGCLSCGTVLSGVSPSLTAHLDFRLHSKQLEDAFADFMQWVIKSKQLLLPLQFISQRKAWVAANKAMRWCNPEELLRGAALKLLPFPLTDVARVDPNITLLRWHMSMQTKNLAPVYGRRSWRRRVQTPTAVYRTTIRELQRWIFGETPTYVNARELELRSRWLKAVDENRIEVMAWNPYELAYVLMRNSQESFIDLGMELSELMLKDTPSFGLASYEDRAPRAAYRAGFVALFAGYFHWMKRARRSGKNLNVQDVISVPPAHLIANFNVPQNESMLISGGVFFPSVPGMPAFPVQGDAGLKSMSSTPKKPGSTQLLKHTCEKAAPF